MRCVQRLLLRIITAIQLTRLTMAFGALSDVWFVILLTRGLSGYDHVNVAQMGLFAALLAGTVVAIGLFAYGAALNDVLDVRHDRAFSPEKPIPSGRIRTGQAVVVTVVSLIIAMLAAEQFGTQALWLGMLVAAAVLFYNVTGKHIPSVGVVSIGLIHAAHMFIPNYALSLTLPVWLIMTHAMALGGLVHVLEDKRPRFNGRSIAAAIAGWVFWSVVILGAGLMRRESIWPPEVSPWAMLLPLIAVAAFVGVMLWKTRRVDGRVAAEKLKRYGAMWQCLYGAAWLLAIGLEGQAAMMGVLAVVGFTAMTLIKEMSGLSGQPVTFRA
jgi:hypothetical protein